MVSPPNMVLIGFDPSPYSKTHVYLYKKKYYFYLVFTYINIKINK